ncbi:MAG: SUMF1/EgtB/PvdO family nonheme iron enzyme [Pseudomonadota bacterium]
MAFITLSGIDEAISQLNANPDTLKGRLVDLIRSYFPDEESLQTRTSIEPAEIILALWETENPEEVRQKKKNLSSLKSALNKSLKELAQEGNNPEGIIINRDNVFSISDEHKDSILQKLGITGSSPMESLDLVAAFRELMSGALQEGNLKETAAKLLNELDKTRQMIARTAGLAGQGSGDGEGDGDGDSDAGSSSDGGKTVEIQEVEIGEDDDFEIIEEIIDDHGEENPEATNGGSVEDGEDDEIAGSGLGEITGRETQDFDENTEIIEVDEEELVDEDNELTGSGLGEMVGGEMQDFDDDTEIVEVDAEELGDEVDELTGSDDGEMAGGETQDFDDDAEIVEVDAEELGDEVDELAGAVNGEMVGGETQDFDDDAEIVEVDAEELGDEVDELAGSGNGEMAGGETQDFDEDAEIVEVDAEELGDEVDELAGSGNGEMVGGETQDFDDDAEIVEVDEEDIVDEVDEHTGSGLGGMPGGELPDFDEDAEIIEVDEEELVDEVDELTGSGLGGMPGGELPDFDEDTEIIEVDEEELFEEAEEHLQDNMDRIDLNREPAPVQPQGTGRTLDLSHYIDANEALTAPPDTLVESHDDYIAQILERFMPKFVKIPADHYIIGIPQPNHNERVSGKVWLKSFYISQLPVTNDLFDFFVRETGYETDAERAGFGNVFTGRISSRTDPETGRHVMTISRGSSSQRVRGANWRHPAGPDSSLENKATHPVVQVSRQDALAFASWAGKRLPNEDEWEAAARGSQGLLFPWGNEWQKDMANVESSLAGDTTPVIRHGQKSMSPFGVYDLLGNVFEWTSTIHHPATPSTGNSPPIYVLKGGCWTSKAGITCAARLLERNTWSNIIGFRCAV